MRDICLGPFSGKWPGLHIKSNTPYACISRKPLLIVAILQSSASLLKPPYACLAGDKQAAKPSFQAVTATSKYIFSSMSWVRACMLNGALRFRIISLKVKYQYYTANDHDCNAGQARVSS